MSKTRAYKTKRVPSHDLKPQQTLPDAYGEPRKPPKDKPYNEVGIDGTKKMYDTGGTGGE